MAVKEPLATAPAAAPTPVDGKPVADNGAENVPQMVRHQAPSRAVAPHLTLRASDLHGTKTSRHG